MLAIVDARAELPVLERRPDWLRVRYRSWKGWVRTGDRGEEPAGEPRPAEPLEPAAPDEVRLARLKELLGRAGSQRAVLGPYDLYTDVEDGRTLDRLGRLADGLAEIYRQRFGLDPGAAGGEVVVLFADEADYRTYESDELEIAGHRTLGYSGHGISVTFVGEQTAEEVAQVVVHELTHLLNRRALGTGIAPWLEEGLAEDLAMSRVDEAGRLRPGTLNGELRVRRQSARRELVEATGARAALGALLAWRLTSDEPGLARFLELPSEEFLRPNDRAHHYAQSAFLVRYLLDARKGRHADAFRAFLRGVAGGEPAEGDGLWRALGLDPAQVEWGFHNWLWRQAQANGIQVAR